MALITYTLKTLQNSQRSLLSACSSTLRHPVGYKSAISLETLYPTSSLKITTPIFDSSNSNEKFSGYIPIKKLDITYSASSGPGGQNVNKVHTKVDLRFKLSEADWLHPDIRQKLIEIHGKKLTKEGYLVLRSDVTRFQQLNLADCLQRLRQMIRNAAEPSPTSDPETAEIIRKRHLRAVRQRLLVKREEAQRRALRQPPTIQDL
ncbi:Peptidyl-tRNA hydrolase ICT1, mitochondrial [Eumeta japonica]|uniref:Large ribosomal subunit protein mL62 n=1 Tax=Eumeta variegata TaxID=151549 RepID=A0A4C1UXV2_EUMVA|nr:Peptidyl-tRNA hydrolase ICT1, mitochondrial [Eumeta japonica]